MKSVSEKMIILDYFSKSIALGSELVYSPIFRHIILFNISGTSKKLNLNHTRMVKLPAIKPSNKKTKKSIKTVCYIAPESFIFNIKREFEYKKCTTKEIKRPERISISPISSRQKEEIKCFYETLIKDSNFEKNELKNTIETFSKINSLTSYYIKEIDAKGIDCIVCRCYYSLENIAIMFACQILGVTFIDIQHGVNGPHHPCYSGFQENEKNTNMLPDYFWVWGDISKKLLSQDNNLPEYCEIIDGGNPFIDYSERSNDPSKVLFTHQPESKGIPLPLNEIKKIQSYTKKIITVRPHPLHLNEGLEATHFLKKNGIPCLLEDPSKKSISESLSETMIHVTYSSTCALDALNYSIPTIHSSIMLDEIENRINTGLIHRIPNKQGFNKILKTPHQEIDYSRGSIKKIAKAVDLIIEKNK